MPRSCAICRNEISGQLKRAREHVIPKWLLQDLSIVDATVTPTITGNQTGVFKLEDIPDITADVFRQRGPHSLDGFLEGRVCKPCNNNLLNRFEIAAKSVLRSLIRREVNVRELEDDQRIALAQWALKTTLIFNIAYDDIERFPATHIEWLRNPLRRLPDGVSVFAQLHDNDEPFGWVGGASWSIGRMSGTSPFHAEMLALSGKSYKLCLQLGPLLLLTGYWPPAKKWSPAFWSEVHVPCWRDKGLIASYSTSCDKFPWNSSVTATMAFFMGLKLYMLSDEALEAIKSGPLVFRAGRYRPVKVGRNVLCPCGSGSKFKHCHGRRDPR
jgi:hypothetical protein